MRRKQLRTYRRVAGLRDAHQTDAHSTIVRDRHEVDRVAVTRSPSQQMRN